MHNTEEPSTSKEGSMQFFYVVQPNARAYYLMSQNDITKQIMKERNNVQKTADSSVLTNMSLLSR